VPRAREIISQFAPLSSVPPETIEQFRTGALHARDLYEMLAGKPAPSIDERGEVPPPT
jgi:hypothetical protein